MLRLTFIRISKVRAPVLRTMVQNGTYAGDGSAWYRQKAIILLKLVCYERGVCFATHVP